MTPDQHRQRAAEIAVEEVALGFRNFDFEQAWKIGHRLVEVAGDRPLAIRIVLAGRTLFSGALDGTSDDNRLWLDRKLATVARFGHSSLWLHHNLRARGRSLADVSGIGPNGGPTGGLDVADHGGGVPIRIGAQVVGAVAVSGLAHEEDHRITMEAMRA